MNASPGPLMAQISPWYSIRQRDGNVYHDDDQCPVGQQIDSKFRMRGHRCRSLCPACAKLRTAATSAERLAKLIPL
ncbi:MAG TPA: hypothetical protein VNO19_09285 [Gemmatimonadales bacterium]|nr:hypothetical protein [Gemmatimonadales bacterium]